MNTIKPVSNSHPVPIILSEINKTDAQLFVRLISGNELSSCSFSAIREEKCLNFQGSIGHLFPRLARMNQEGFGIYMVINECAGPRNTKNISRVRALFYDDDGNMSVSSPLPPSFTVQSVRGEHGYFLLSDEVPLAEFANMQKAISVQLGTDPSVHDLPRLMRVPGFFHVKDRSQPKLVTILKTSERRYGYADLVKAFCHRNLALKQSNSGQVAGPSDNFSDWCGALPEHEGASNSHGGRNNTALLLVREGLGRGIPFEGVRTELEKYCSRSGLCLEEAESLLRRQHEQHRRAEFVPLFMGRKKSFSIAPFVDAFLSSSSLLLGNGNSALAFWRGDFFRYTGTHYEKFPLTDLKARIVGFFRANPELKDKFKKSWLEEVVTHLTGMSYVPSNVEPGTDLETGERCRQIVLRDCILAPGAGPDGSIKSIDHDSRYFTLVCLPFAHDPAARCEKFLEVLSEILPDQEAREFIQEWFGYNLIHDTSQAKFVVLVGDGANGKTVLLTVLTALLGRANVSAVPLESFAHPRPFQIAATIGKLANLVDEVGNLNGAEANLKQFVSGTVMNLEKKYDNGTEQTPTARLTVATNSLPSFRDRTDGLWRRLIVIPMSVQFSEDRQDKRLGQVEYWERSGELPGILNWALDGLDRLTRRGRFVEPVAGAEFKRGYRADCDQVTPYLAKHVETGADARVGTTTLYQRYVNFAKDSGLYPIGPANFSQAVMRAFPGVTRSRDPQVLESGRERVWSGIRLRGDF